MKSKKYIKHPTEHSAFQRLEASINVKNKFVNSKAYQNVFKKSDDGIIRKVLLSELYDNVPKHLKNVTVDVMELHNFECSPSMKRKVKKWLNNT